jgi:hypothetical protein
MVELFVGIVIWAAVGLVAAVAVGRASAIGTSHRIPCPLSRLPRG